MTIHGVKDAKLAVELNGAVDLTADGATKDLQLDLSGMGSVNQKELKAESASVSLSGAGSVDVFASRSLKVEISGAGRVRYYGHPQELHKDISGLGNLEPR